MNENNICISHYRQVFASLTNGPQKNQQKNSNHVVDLAVQNQWKEMFDTMKMKNEEVFLSMAHKPKGAVMAKVKINTPACTDSGAQPCN